MLIRSIYFLIVLGICKIKVLIPVHAAVVVDEPIARTTYIRLFGSLSKVNHDEGNGDSMAAFIQFHVFGAKEFPIHSNRIDNDLYIYFFCGNVASAMWNITRFGDLNESDGKEKTDDMSTVLRMVWYGDLSEHMHVLCMKDMLIGNSGMFSFVYSTSEPSVHENSFSIFPPPIYNLSKQYYKLYEFNHETKVVEELPLNGISTFYFSPNASTNVGPRDDSWNVQLMTNVSPFGGMHRDMHHTLYFYNNETNHSGPSQSGRYNGSLEMLLHLPADLFINIEDCFHWKNDPQNAFQIETVSALKSDLIDQEEPSFASRPHLLRIQIDFSVLLPTTVASTSEKKKEENPAHLGLLEFTTLVHARYPKPLSTRELHNFQLILIPSPILIAGKLRGQNDVDFYVMPVRENPTMLQWWVAPGHQSHFPLVLGITIAASLIGAIWMLYDLSRVSVWD